MSRIEGSGRTKDSSLGEGEEEIPLAVCIHDAMSAASLDSKWVLQLMGTIPRHPNQFVIREP